MAKTTKDKRKLVVDLEGTPMKEASKIVRELVRVESVQDALKAMAVLKQAHKDFTDLVMGAYESIKRDHVDGELDDMIKNDTEYTVEIPKADTVFKYAPKVTTKYARSSKAADNAALQKVYPELIEEKTTLYLRGEKELEAMDEQVKKAISDGYLELLESKELKETMKEKKKKVKK